MKSFRIFVLDRVTYNRISALYFPYLFNLFMNKFADKNYFKKTSDFRSFMKTFLFISIIFLFGCSKVTKKSPDESAMPSVKESAAYKLNSGISKDTIEKNDSKQIATDLGYIKYGISKVPEGIQYSGSVVAMAQWDDKLGSNILFVTETSENSNEDTRSKELFGYHYITDNSENVLLWKINDFIKDCPVDLTLEYLDKSLEITDLDKNGIGESSFLYKMSCKGDVSADDMKLIMHEDKNKYAIRGTMNLMMNGQVLEKGSMKVDPSFNKAPLEFPEYAEKQWNRFKTENVGN